MRFRRTNALTETQVAELRAKRKRGELIRTLMKEYDISKATIPSVSIISETPSTKQLV